MIVVCMRYDQNIDWFSFDKVLNVFRVFRQFVLTTIDQNMLAAWRFD